MKTLVFPFMLICLLHGVWRSYTLDTPLTCNFEDPDICGYTHDTTADFNWTRFSGPTSSFETGPDNDHTFASSVGHYMYIETSYTDENDTARLISRLYDPPPQPQCLEFWYHMHGIEIGRLSVYYQQNGIRGKPKFTIEGNKGNTWLLGQIEIPGNSLPFRVIFEGTDGISYRDSSYSYRADIGIDDIAVKPWYCNTMLAGPHQTVLTPNLITYSTVEGSSLPNVTCTCSGCNPTCTVIWSFNGVNIGNSSTVVNSTVDRFSSGRYTCACVNPATFNTTTAFFDLDVKYGPYNATVSPKNASYTIGEGNRMPDIHCTCGLCNPSCFARWFYNGNNMGTDSILQLGTINRNVSGEYTCRCRNPGTMVEISTVVQMNVEYGPDNVLLSPEKTSYALVENSFIPGINCTCGICNPSCSAQWFFNGNNMGSSSILKLGYINRNSSGEYSCRCSNPNTMVTKSSVAVTVNVEYGPDEVSLSPEKSRYTIAEESLLQKINCTCGTCNPSCDAQWYYNNSEIGNSGLLEIGATYRNTSGEYVCRCTNPNTMAEKSSAVIINVEYGPDEVALSPQNTSYTLVEGNGVPEIDCMCGRCNPSCIAQWFHTDMIIENNSILSLGLTNRNLSGEYECRCTNSGTMKNKSTVVMLDIEYGPDTIVLFPQNTSYSLVEGSLVPDIDCSCEKCNPSCYVQWDYNDDRMGSSNILQLGHINRNSSGEYECRCTNPGTMKSKSKAVALTVKYGPDNVTLSPQNTSYSLIEGSLVPNIECTCGICNPSCTAQWDYNDNRMGNSNLLQLGHINRNSSGEYVCQCTNPGTLENNSTAVDITVEYGPDHTVLNPSNRTYFVRENHPGVNILCTCGDCVPSCSLKWFFNGQTLESDTIDIYNVSRHDAGRYTCNCSNKRTKQETEEHFDLLVSYGPDSTVLIPNNATYSRAIGSYFGNIECKCVECAPQCEVTWSKSGKVIVNSSVLELGKLSLQNTGQYVCRCSNPTTKIEKMEEFQLTVNALPDIHPCPENIDDLGTSWNETLAGDTVSLDCPDEGYTGTISRECSKTGHWETPLYDCVRASISKIEEKLEEMLKNVSQAEISPVLDVLANITDTKDNKVDSMYPGELERVTEALNVVAKIADSGKPPTQNQSRSFVRAVGNVLNKENKKSWKLSNSKADNGASKLLQSVDIMSGAVAKGLLNNTNASTVTIVQENIVMEVSKVADDQPSITFPASSDLQDSKATAGAKLSLPIARDADSNPKSYTVVLYDYESLEGLLPNTVNLKQNNATEENMELGTAVLSLQVFPKQGQLQEPLIITFEKQKVNYYKDVCTFWNFIRNQWETDGCRVRSSDGSSIVCECDHLTNFAVLMSPLQEPSVDDDALEIISVVGCTISIICLVATTVLHIVLWRNVKNDRAVILLNINVALIVAYIIFLAGIDQTSNEAACKAIAALLHYMLLVVFCLMLTEGIEITITVKYVFLTKSRIKWIIPLAWGVPAVIVGLSLGISRLKGYGTEHFCWLSVETGIIWAFVGPAMLIITANLVFLGILLRTMLKTKAYAEMSEMNRIKSSARCLCVLVPLMGCTWVLGIFYVNKGSQWIQYVFALCNSLQGFFIFLFHGLLNKQVQTAIKGRYKKYSASHSLTTKHSISKSSHSVSKSSSMRRTEVTGVMNPAYMSTVVPDAESECTEQKNEKKEPSTSDKQKKEKLVQPINFEMKRSWNFLSKFRMSRAEKNESFSFKEEKPVQLINFDMKRPWNFLKKFRMSRTDATGVMDPAYMTTEIPEHTEQKGEKKSSFSSDDPVQEKPLQKLNFGRKRSWTFKQCGSYSPMQ